MSDVNKIQKGKRKGQKRKNCGEKFYRIGGVKWKICIEDEICFESENKMVF